MEIEKLEIYDFLKKCHPLDKLSEVQLTELAQSIEISYFRRSQEVFKPETNNEYLYLIRSGAVERTDDSHGLVAKFTEKDFFGHRALERGGTIKKFVHAVEDSLFYMIPGHLYFKLMKENKAFLSYFHQEKNKRLRSAINEIHAHDRNILDSTSVRELLHTDILILPPETSIQETAIRMSSDNKTAAIIMQNNQIVGIVTDRVFCTKVVANTLDSGTPVATIMSQNLISVTPENTGLDAMLIMARNNIRHLPVVENQQLLGVLTATDLIHHQSYNPIYAINEIHKATEISQLVLLCKTLPQTLCKLVDAGMRAHDISYSISSVGRAVAQRLLKMAEKKFGPSPVDYAFVVAGSLARNDQTVHSDQDNGIILSDDYNENEHGEYFKNLAQFVSDGLNQCGYVYCPGDVMATNTQWRQPYSVWKSYFHKWIFTPKPKALMYSSIFFDMRCIYGNRKLLDDLHDEIHEMITKNKLFITYMAANAQQNTPPLGIFRRFVLEKHGEEDKSLNMKKRGIMPCTDMARVFALDAGINQINTRERLKQAHECKIISKEAKNDLLDAFDFLCLIRLKHQAGQIKQGKEANNHVSPEELSSLERRHLKDAFEIIRTYQDVLSNRYTQGRM